MTAAHEKKSQIVLVINVITVGVVASANVVIAVVVVVVVVMIMVSVTHLYALHNFFVHSIVLSFLVIQCSKVISKRGKTNHILLTQAYAHTYAPRLVKKITHHNCVTQHDTTQ